MTTQVIDRLLLPCFLYEGKGYSKSSEVRDEIFCSQKYFKEMICIVCDQVTLIALRVTANLEIKGEILFER